MKRHIKTAVTVATLAWTASSTLSADACDRGGQTNIDRSKPHRILHLALPLPPLEPPGLFAARLLATPARLLATPARLLTTPARLLTTPARLLTAAALCLPDPSVVHRIVGRSHQPRMVNPATGGMGLTSQGVPAASTSGSPSVLPTQGVGRPQPNGQTSPTARSANTPSTPDSDAGGQAEASALKLLASINDPGSDAPEQTAAQIPEFSTPASSATDSHVGNWRVTLPGNQSVELVLNSDNSFQWTATKGGKSSSFQGQYRLEDGRLTLVRSRDLQQMAGSWTGQDSGFTFKLDGAKAAGLSFSRS